MTHNYGLAEKNGTFQVSRKALRKGQSTYIAANGPAATEDDTIKVTIKSFNHAFAEAGGCVPDLLHVNCEGCEWDMIPQAKQAGFLDRIPPSH